MMVVGALFGLLVATADPAASCPTCDPNRYLREAEQTLDAALSWHLEDGRSPPDLPARQALAALEVAEGGDLAGAEPFARAAAANCLVAGQSGCGEMLPLLAEAAIRDGEQGYDKALAWLALVPYEEVSRRNCLDAVVLRYRLAEKRSPRSADPAWADRCGPQGGHDEPGYRAAKAALLRGAPDDAIRRLKRLRAFGSRYAVRAQYLHAVALVSQGKLDAAKRAFTRVTTLYAAPHRSQEEDDARVLAMLQLARVERERKNPALALHAYRSVPSGTPARGDALVEGAVVAAHVGDLGAARNYLEALPTYRPDSVRNVEVARLLASLAVIDGDEDAALATFRTLTQEGLVLRARTFGPNAAPIRAQLAEDPTLGGILDERDATRLIHLENEIATLQAIIDEGQTMADEVRAVLLDRGVAGPERRALDLIDEASHLVSRADALISQRESNGITLAGPEGAAMVTARRAQAVRRAVDAARAKVGAAHTEKTMRAGQILDDVEKSLDEARARIELLDEDARRIIDNGYRVLALRAEEVIRRLEMSEDIGSVELFWQKKQRSSLDVKRVHTEYYESMATLKSDSGNGSE